MRRILSIVILVPLTLALVALAVANRHPVSLVLDPFAGSLEVALPVFALVFAALIVGVVLGGAAVWFSQGRYRKAARRSSREARRAHEEVETLRATLGGDNRPRGQALSSGQALPSGEASARRSLIPAERRDAA